MSNDLSNDESQTCNNKKKHQALTSNTLNAKSQKPQFYFQNLMDFMKLYDYYPL